MDRLQLFAELIARDVIKTLLAKVEEEQKKKGGEESERVTDFQQP